MSPRLRTCLGALACVVVGAAIAPFAAVSDERPADASTLLAVTVDDLVDRADVIAVATAKARSSRWEGGRIVTYTTMVVDTPVAGAVKGDEILVRTLGGVIGDYGEKVFGEAVLPLDKQTLIFARPLTVTLAIAAIPGARSIVAMEQGAIPVVVDKDKTPRLASANVTLDVLSPKAPKDVPARVALADRIVADAVVDLKKRWIAHGKK